MQASIQEFLNRPDLTSAIPTWITLAETQMNRRLRVADMMASTTLSVSAAATSLPADFNGVVSFELPSGSGGPLRYEKPEGLRAQRQTNYAASGTPFLWTVIGKTIEVAPPPSQTFVCNLVYYQTLAALTNSNTSNWLLTKHPDAYLYGALLQSAPYLKDDDRIQAWGQLYTAALEDILASDGRTAFGAGLSPPFRGASARDGMDGPSAPTAAPGP